MPSQSLELSSPTLLAEYVPQSAFTGFLEKRLAAPPDHAAVLIRNGQVAGAYKGAHFSVGGLFSALKSAVLGSQHIRILLADLRPFAVQAPIKCLTKDKFEAAGVVTLELQLNPDAPENILGIVSPSGVLTREAVLTRFLPHFNDRVF